jgi:hypothetical protein
VGFCAESVLCRVQGEGGAVRVVGELYLGFGNGAVSARLGRWCRGHEEMQWGVVSSWSLEM